jgi:hypothetical protein
MNIKGVAGMYFILAFAGCFIALLEGEEIYIRVLAGAYACLLTYQLLLSYESNRDDFTNDNSN